MNDNERRAPEWRRLLGEFFSPRLGGSAEAWGRANAIVMNDIFTEWRTLQDSAADIPFNWFTRQDPRWLGGMCERVGVPTPADTDGVARASQRYVLERIECAFEDAAPAIRALRSSGRTLHTASGELTADLEPYLERMGVRELFDRLYGPDLIRTPKTGPRYYEGILEDSGADPQESIVVDDSPKVLEWASAAGFRAIHMDRVGQGSRFERVTSLDQLLPLLDG
jgi:HAD superfamily hydrolase (TIGR01509 family)